MLEIYFKKFIWVIGMVYLVEIMNCLWGSQQWSTLLNIWMHVGLWAAVAILAVLEYLIRTFVKKRHQKKHSSQ